MEGFPLRPLVTVMAAKFRRGNEKVTNGITMQNRYKRKVSRYICGTLYR